ncbi:unnamed protein product [Allacma fusca]|uniref:Glutathione S-transferase n=1 Tax=Allacma fusca TaxID=39272 RepID=A0A8J2L6E8_9HEXA|nr:unnamed protein product [Allacma fusca]
MSQRVLYTVGDSPPGRAVQMTLQYLELSYEIKQVDFDNGEHFSKDYLEMYPQGELPVLDDFGYIVGESVAIIQYLASKYPRDETFYPKDPEKNSVVHHRLAFYLSTYYRRIHDYYILPMDYAYERTEDNKKKLNHALRIFDDILRKQNALYAAGDKLTIADVPLVMGTSVLVAMKHDLQPFKYINKWFQDFQENRPKLWSVAKEGLDGLEYFNLNPRDMSHLKHPIHPTKSSEEAGSKKNT